MRPTIAAARIYAEGVVGVTYLRRSLPCGPMLCHNR
ncbi:hypothetical protein Rrhod_0342 [Rhodococcus rhodnii LMG 5362]|uniref:Uncharacterized protein n=1 Tax=Rhodococcus rhodnii LMG 5362 TaxID=1273125 RepID=R7WSC5_9NOCA|nr:hypothetical protein Rrhod_0342 [Rhodococcus rhodnii LMG 5362]